MKLYMISGLGADGRIFERLAKHLPEVDVVALDWIAPENCRSLGDYAQLYQKHIELEPPYMLGGVSMGGMIAQEWSLLAKPEKLVLISTLCHRSEFPPLIRIAHSIGITRILRKPFLVWLAKFVDRCTAKSPKGKSLFYDMLQSADSKVMEFGARAVSAWIPCATAVQVIRIHGTADMVIPAKRLKTPARLIAKGTHFMIVDRVGEIAEILKGVMK